MQASTTSDAVTALYIYAPEPSEPEIPISGQNVSHVPRVLYTEGKNHPALCFLVSPRRQLQGDRLDRLSLVDFGPQHMTY